jgi:tRNA C32,U32 (ribose-2'-O)-methylase TrmJ
MGDTLDPIRIVLVRPKFAANVGATARAMANTGLRQLVLVNPAADPASSDARKCGARAGDILDAARTVPTLGAALEGVIYTVGLTCRGGLYREQIEVSPEAMALEAVTRARRGNVAVLFGAEGQRAHQRGVNRL